MGKAVVLRVSTIGPVNSLTFDHRNLYIFCVFFFFFVVNFYAIFIFIFWAENRESEYAAWTLVNGYALNHVTISAHRLRSRLRNIRNLNEFIEESGFKLNSDGGVLKGCVSF